MIIRDHAPGAAVVFAAIGVAALVVSSCSSTKTAVGEGLLTDITGQVSRRDTIEYPLDGSASITHLNVPVHLSQSASERLLVGDANGLRATTLLKFAELTAWTEERSYELNGEWLTDTVTITPVAIAADSASHLLLTFAGYVTDSSAISFSGSIVSNDWSQDDSVTTAPPFPLATLFSGFVPDSFLVGDVFTPTLPTSALGPIVSDSLSILVAGEAGRPMHAYASLEALEGTAYSPQLNLWTRATVESRRTDLPPAQARWDTTVGLTLRPAYDVYRLERLVPAPSPPSNILFLAGGAPWRSYVRLNRCDIPGLSVDGVMPKQTTVNSAILELDVGSGANAFQSGSAHLEIHALSEAFDYDLVQNNTVSVDQTRLSTTGFGSFEARLDTPNVRRFQIADLANNWWHDSTSNLGVLIHVNTTTYSTSLGVDYEEDRRVDAVEITGVRLIVTTTLPPVFVQNPTAAVRESRAVE